MTIARYISRSNSDGADRLLWNAVTKAHAGSGTDPIHMIAYNTTYKVSWAVATAWLAWLEQEYIPEIMASGIFERYALYRLLEQDDTEGPTYTIQYFTVSKERLDTYLTEFDAGLRRKSQQTWNDQVIGFSSVLQQMRE